MKKFSLIASALMLFASLPATAQTQGNFNVNVTLTSACQLAIAGDINITYTSFAAADSRTTDFTVLCTDGLSYSLSLDAYDADTLGLVIPLTIRDAAGTAVIASTDTQTQSGSTATTYKVRADYAGGQQGTCTGASCTDTVQRILTVTY